MGQVQRMTCGAPTHVHAHACAFIEEDNAIPRSPSPGGFSTTERPKVRATILNRAIIQPFKVFCGSMGKAGKEQIEWQRRTGLNATGADKQRAGSYLPLHTYVSL